MMLFGLVIAGALLAESPDVLVRVTDNDARPETLTKLSESTTAGLEAAGCNVTVGPAWPESCADDACVREAMVDASANALVLLSVEQQDNVYRFVLEARRPNTGERIATVEDECEICGLDEVAELVELRAAALGPRLESPENGIVRVSSDPPGAVVYVDDRQVGATPLELALPEGPHTVRLEKRGFLEDARAIDVRESIEDELRFSLVPAPAASKVARRWFLAGGVSLGLGIAGVAAGIPMLLMHEKPYEPDCRADIEGNCSHLYDTLGAGASLTTAGAIGLGAGAAMLLIGRKHRARRLEMQPTAGGLSMRF